MSDNDDDFMVDDDEDYDLVSFVFSFTGIFYSGILWLIELNLLIVCVQY